MAETVSWTPMSMFDHGQNMDGRPVCQTISEISKNAFSILVAVDNKLFNT